MWRKIVFLFLVAPILIGCGPSERELREKTLSVLNTEADKWDGGKEYKTTAEDAYGRAIAGTVEKTTFENVLELRSAGPDGLPKNSDDIVVTRRKPHGETSFVKEAEKMTEGIGRGGASGVVQGIKKGLGVGGEKKK